MRALLLLVTLMVAGVAHADRERPDRPDPRPCRCAQKKPPRALVRVVANGGEAAFADDVARAVARQYGEALARCLASDDGGAAAIALRFARGATAPKVSAPDAGAARACVEAIAWRALPAAPRRLTIKLTVGLASRGDAPSTSPQ
jgi:hypothetical protein